MSDVIARLRALEEAATPGEWYLDERDGAIRGDGGAFVTDNDLSSGNEQLLIAMRNSFAALLDIAEAAQAMVAEVQDFMRESGRILPREVDLAYGALDAALRKLEAGQ